MNDLKTIADELRKIASQLEAQCQTKSCNEELGSVSDLHEGAWETIQTKAKKIVDSTAKYPPR
ncbi:MAG: hypothetical protein MK106_13835 [Mariniblastus sp.]|nr:hypothetical protein [Mariniblastus sp.]